MNPSDPDVHPEVCVCAGRSGQGKNVPFVLHQRGEIALQKRIDASEVKFSSARYQEMNHTALGTRCLRQATSDGENFPGK